MKPNVYRSVLFYTLFLAMLLYWDLVLRIMMSVGRRYALRWGDKMAVQMCTLVFAVSRIYLDHTIEVGSASSLSRLPSRFLLIANHQSIVDIPVLVTAFRRYRLRFVAKSSLFSGVPLISPLLRLQGHAAVNRSLSGEARRDTLKQLDALVARIPSGISPVVFPEGTRTRDGSVGKFRSGAAFHLVRRCNLPIVAVAMNGGWKVATARKLGRNLQGLRYRVFIEGVYPPPSSREETRELMKTIRARIASHVEQMQK